MQVIEETEIRMEWTDIRSYTPHAPPSGNHRRSPGVHLSGVIRYIAIRSGILRSVDSTGRWAGDGDIEDDEMPMRMAVGFAWEQWAAGLYPFMHYQPGEMSCDEIYGTPDGLSENPSRGNGYEILLEEFKATWKSAHTHPITGQWMWMRQVMGYLKMLREGGYPDAHLARMHVLWVNGGYRPPAPRYIRYLIDFTAHEIDTCWGLLLRHRDNPGVIRE